MSPRRSNAKRTEATRAQLIGVARQLFGERGYSATTIAEIARSAGLTTGALYHHWPGKEALLVDVVHDVHRELAARIRSGEAVGAMEARGADRATEVRGADRAVEVRGAGHATEGRGVVRVTEVREADHATEVPGAGHATEGRGADRATRGREAAQVVEGRGAGRAVEGAPVPLLLRSGLEFLGFCADPAVARLLLLDAPAVLGYERWRRIDEQWWLSPTIRLVERARLERGGPGAAEAGADGSRQLALVLLGALTSLGHEVAMKGAATAVSAGRTYEVLLKSLLC
ncbi:TetR/AcrR family transcriptional regulator [Streptomyces sp. AN091965]|uniref:TetR/AcrR family transcriptional regulator n=1 Tax=Streptomyces sp. AN091965 TaxID=2927803 RepID=UPI001F600B2F|nr:TetR/AcrR family transcriptional regulator [Streptomyces sp. AN091965]MCI3928530.1 TetR/AcrR family transcriptional regulator [Streptomyces sp. AN091965]